MICKAQSAFVVNYPDDIHGSQPSVSIVNDQPGACLQPSKGHSGLVPLNVTRLAFAPYSPPVTNAALITAGRGAAPKSAFSTGRQWGGCRLPARRYLNAQMGQLALFCV